MKPLDLIKQLVLEAGPYSEVMQPFQLADFEAIFATHPDGRPLYRLCYSERRRGESKTEDLAAVALADIMTSPPRSRSYAVAADIQQASLILDSIRGFAARSTVLAGLEVGRDIVTNPATDSQLIVLASDAPTAFGIRPRKIYFDEFSLQVRADLWTAMWSSIGKSPRSQLIAVSMAGSDFTSIAWTVHELAASKERYYFASRQGSELAPWLSIEDMEEQQATLHPADFAKFWQCQWMESAGSFITQEQYALAETGTEATIGDPKLSYYAGIDVGLVKDATVIAIVHAEGDRVVLDRMVTLQGTATNEVLFTAIEETVLDLSRSFNVRHWLFESWQAVATTQRLQERLGANRVSHRPPTGPTQGNLWGVFYRLFANHLVTLFPHERLRKETLNLVAKESGGRRVAIGSSAVHQDHCIAFGLAAEQCVGRKETPTYAPPLMWKPSVARIAEGEYSSDAGIIAAAASQPQPTRRSPLGTDSRGPDVAADSVAPGTVCNADRAGKPCGGTLFNSEQECLLCGTRPPSASTGSGTPMPWTSLKRGGSLW